VVVLPAASAVMAAPTMAGVLGIARITATSFPSFSCMNERGVEATTEITRVPGLIALAISSSTCAMICGFTAMITMGAPETASRLLVLTATPPSEAASESHRSSC
jgi:hypothetical protein